MSTEEGDTRIGRLRTVTLVGALACLTLFAGVIVPYVVVPAGGTAAYYGVTPIGPPVVAALSVLGLGLFALGAFDLYDAWIVAGAIVGVGLVTLVIACYWAVSVPPGLVMGLSRTEELAYHRWFVVALATITPAIGIWYTKLAISGSKAVAGPVDG